MRIVTYIFSTSYSNFPRVLLVNLHQTILEIITHIHTRHLTRVCSRNHHTNLHQRFNVFIFSIRQIIKFKLAYKYLTNLHIKLNNYLNYVEKYSKVTHNVQKLQIIFLIPQLVVLGKSIIPFYASDSIGVENIYKRLDYLLKSFISQVQLFRNTQDIMLHA